MEESSFRNMSLQYFVLSFADPVVSYPVSAGFNSFTDSPPTPAPALERIKVMVSSLIMKVMIMMMTIPGVASRR